MSMCTSIGYNGNRLKDNYDVGACSYRYQTAENLSGGGNIFMGYAKDGGTTSAFPYGTGEYNVALDMVKI